MKVYIIKKDDIIDVNDSYAARLIEQGKAIPYIEKAKPEKVKATKPVAEEKGDE